MPKSTISMETIYKNIEVAGVPGLIFSIIDDRQLTLTQLVGVKNSETKEPVVANTIFKPHH